MVTRLGTGRLASRSCRTPAWSRHRDSGAASGSGDLFWWDATLNGGLGDWVLARSGVAFTANFYDSGGKGKKSTDTFGIRIVYSPVSPPQPNSLPNSDPQPLKGGDVKVS